MKKSVVKSATVNTIRYIDDEHALVTKAFAKKATIFGTPEFDLWRAYKKEFENAKMVTKKIKKNPNKKNTRISYAKMRAFIKLVGTKDDLAALEKQIALSKIADNPYKAVLNWFKNYEKYEKYEAFNKKYEELEAKKAKKEAEAKAKAAEEEFEGFDFNLEDLDLEDESEESEED